MTCVIVPRKNLTVLFVSLHFLLLFCCHISCVLISVTREEADIFSYSGISTACYLFCQEKGSFFHRSSPDRSICICRCSSARRTFIIAESKCIADRTLRNTKETSLKFRLARYEQPGGALTIIPLDSNVITIPFYVQDLGEKRCTLNDVEELSRENFNQWNSVKHLLDYVYGDGAFMLKWKNVNPAVRFAGLVMRLSVTCAPLVQGSSVTGVMVFKVKGTFTVPKITISPSTLVLDARRAHVPSPTPYVGSKIFIPSQPAQSPNNHSHSKAPSVSTTYHLSASNKSLMSLLRTTSEGFISFSPSKTEFSRSSSIDLSSSQTTSASSIDLSSSQTTSASSIDLSLSQTISASSTDLSLSQIASASSIGFSSSQTTPANVHIHTGVFSSRIVLIAVAVGNGLFITVVFTIILKKYKPSKTPVLPTLGKKSMEAVETPQESLPPNNQGLGCENIAVVVEDFYDDVHPTSTEGDISIYEEVLTSSSVGQSYTQGDSLYEEVCEPSFAWKANAPRILGYTELDILKREATDGNDYQGLLKENYENAMVQSIDTQYVVPNDNQNEMYEEPNLLAKNPGYTDLHRNEKIADGENYQKLLKQDNGIPADERVTR